MTSLTPLPGETPSQRPEWLNFGQAFCPGPKEAYKMRIDTATGQALQACICVHGIYSSIPDAWAAHEAMPGHGIPVAEVSATELDSQSTQALD